MTFLKIRGPYPINSPLPFTWAIDVALQNAWLLHREVNQRMSLLEFRRSIATRCLSKYREVPTGAGRPKLSKDSSIDSRVSDEVRLDGYGHLIQNEKSNKRRRCAGPTCSSKGRTECKKCNVGLCVPCFTDFHTGLQYQKTKLVNKIETGCIFSRLFQYVYKVVPSAQRTHMGTVVFLCLHPKYQVFFLINGCNSLF